MTKSIVNRFTNVVPPQIIAGWKVQITFGCFERFTWLNEFSWLLVIFSQFPVTLPLVTSRSFSHLPSIVYIVQGTRTHASESDSD